MKPREIAGFLEKLIQRVKMDPNFPPNEVHIFNVHAAYGHYQVVIGPAKKILNSRSAKRPLEIHGAIHHLFLTKNHVAPHPTHKQIHNSLKGCIIMRDLTVHIKDPTGSGRKVENTKEQNVIQVREQINLAGTEGEQILNRMVASGKLAKETYKIVQEDILNALVNKQYTSD